MSVEFYKVEAVGLEATLIQRPKAKQLRGAVIMHQLSKPWALSYVDDDSLQALENAAMKIMEFIDTRRKKFEV